MPPVVSGSSFATENTKVQAVARNAMSRFRTANLRVASAGSPDGHDDLNFRTLPARTEGYEGMTDLIDA